ncbi:MAG: NTP transferase domain-containing protein, partial [Nitrospirota bacterium]
MGVTLVIPARYGSKRFPGKPLVPIGGRPLIQHVYELALKARFVKEVIVATDDQRILDKVKSFGGNALITSDKSRTGGDRLAEVAGRID